MVDLPKKKVGIVSCSGEELPEGTISRLAALRVLEHERPGDTVTICLPLFLAGGEGDRAFARFYPTIAVDGCELRCAARGTEMYSGKPAASIVISELIQVEDGQSLGSARRLSDSGREVVKATAQKIAGLVDELLDKPWSRRAAPAAAPDIQLGDIPVIQEEVQATCACGSGIPIQQVEIGGNIVTLVGLPVIFQQARDAGKAPSEALVSAMLATVKIYNPVPKGAEPIYAEAIGREYHAYWEKGTHT